MRESNQKPTHLNRNRPQIIKSRASNHNRTISKSRSPSLGVSYDGIHEIQDIELIDDGSDIKSVENIRSKGDNHSRNRLERMNKFKSHVVFPQFRFQNNK